jgi:hypothetical protein
MEMNDNRLSHTVHIDVSGVAVYASECVRKIHDTLDLLVHIVWINTIASSPAHIYLLMHAYI